MEKSEVARHFCLEDHRADWVGSGVIDVERHHSKRLVKEAFWSRSVGSSNRCFHSLSEAWDGVAQSRLPVFKS